jgi:hypothetical protein
MSYGAHRRRPSTSKQMRSANALATAASSEIGGSDADLDSSIQRVKVNTASTSG